LGKSSGFRTASRRKGQGSTEYLVVFGAVLAISLIVVMLLATNAGNSPDKAESDAYWASLTPIKITSSRSDNGNLVLTVQNSGNERIWLTGIRTGATDLDLYAYTSNNSYGQSYCSSASGSPVCDIYLQIGKPVVIATQYSGQCSSSNGHLKIENITLFYRTKSISGFSLVGERALVVPCSSDTMAALATPSPVASATPAPYAVLSGQVTNTYGIGVSGATVNLTNSSGQYATANSSGHYSINVSLGGQGAAFLVNASAGTSYNYTTGEVSLNAGVPATRNFIISAISPIEFIFFVTNENGTNIAEFTPTGDIVLKGGCYSGGSCAGSPDGSFEIRDASGVAHAYINSTGSLCIEEANCNDHDASCEDSPDGSFDVTNSSGHRVSYISPTGTLCLIGSLVQYGNP